jgi:hypothetical protein
MHDQMKTMSSELNKNQLHLAKEKAQSALFFEEAESVGRDYSKLLLEFDEQAAEKSILEAQLAAIEQADKAVDKANQLQAIVQNFQFDLEEALNESPQNGKTIFSAGSPEAKFVSKTPLVQNPNGCPTAFSPVGQVKPDFDDAGSETDSDVEDDFNYDTQPQSWTLY